LPIATPVEKEAETKGPGETKAESKGSLVACIAKECRSYTRPSEQQLEESFLTRRRFAWPCESQSLVELQEVLDFVRRTTKTKGSRDILDRGMRYFFEIFEFSDERQATLEKVDVKEAFKVLYDRKLIHKAIGLDLLHESISWTRCINEALEKLCDFLMMAYEDDEDDRGMRIAGACKVRVVEPLKKKVNAERAKQTERRKKIDAIRMGNILPVSSQNDVAKQSMWDMKVVRDAYIEEFKKKGTVPQLVRRCLNTQAYGVSAYRAYPGRPGEWKRMTKGMIEECVNDENRWYVVITDHKTFKSSGALGRYIPDDVKFVFRILLEFAPPESKYLYQSPSGGCVEIHRLALEHGLMYSPKFEVPEPTLMRKYVETMVADKQNKDKAARMIEMAEAHAPSEANQAAAKMAAKFSGHSFSTGGKYYNLNANDPEEHAYASKAYIECFVGPVLDSPEPPANTQRTAEIILEDFKNATTRAGQHDLMGESEAEAEDDEVVKDAEADEGDAKGEDEEGAEEEVEDEKADIEHEAEEELLQLLDSHAHHSSSQGASSSKDQPQPKRQLEPVSGDERSKRLKVEDAIDPDKEVGIHVEDELDGMLEPVSNVATQGAVEVVPDAKGGRRIEYDSEKGLFTKHETAVPNLVVHAEVKAKTQTKLVLAPSSRRKNETRNPDVDDAANAAGPVPNASSDKVYEISEADQHVLWAHAAVARGEGFTELEKKYLISKLRLAQGSSIDPLRKHVLELIIRKGLEEGVLVRVLLTPAKFFERVRQFVRQFIKMSEADQDDEPAVAASSAVASSAGDAEDID
jgi:hypothetical protein